MATTSYLPAPRRYWPLLSRFGVSCTLLAIDSAWLAWRFLPYERLYQTSPAERFFLWEGVVWLAGLLAIFLGSALVLQVVGWRFQDGAVEFLNRLDDKDDGHRAFLPTAALPAWLISYGLLLVAIASLTRLFLAT